MGCNAICIMNYALALLIKSLNPIQTEEFVISHLSQLEMLDVRNIENIDLSNGDQINGISMLSEPKIAKIKNNLIWSLCFVDKQYYFGSIGDNISDDDWNKQITNISFIENGDSELLFTIVDESNVMKLYLASKNVEVGQFRKETAEMYFKSVGEMEKMIAFINENNDLRMVYMYNY